MSNPYERAKTGRLIFKGGDLAATKSIDKKNKKKKKKLKSNLISDEPQPSDQPETYINDDGDGDGVTPEADNIYTIDAAKKMKYDELFPVEAKKFRYDPKAKSASVEQALDDRVKKKADRYCK